MELIYLCLIEELYRYAYRTCHDCDPLVPRFKDIRIVELG